MAKKIVIVTTGQPSTNPRMLKEYKALKEESYDVKVIYSYWAEWAVLTDEILFATAGLSKKDFILAGGSPAKGRWKYFTSMIIYKFSKKASPYFPEFYPYAIARTAYYLLKTAIKEKADLYIGHNMGALPAIINCSKLKKTPAVFDVEDYYSGQIKDKGSIEYKICTGLELKYLRECNALLFSSNNIAEVYTSKFSFIPAAVIHNVVEKEHILQSLPHLAAYPLKLAWFSQQIGTERGLESVIEGLNKLDSLQIELHLLGNCSPEYITILKSMMNNSSKLFFYDPIPANCIVNFLSDKHIGLATETARDENNDLALSNKIFTYLAAGNALVLSDTSAQKQFLDDNRDVGFIYKKNNSDSFCSLICKLYHNPNITVRARLKALEIVGEKFNWENESQKFKMLIKEQLKQ